MRKRWNCGRCGANGTTRIESVQVWHRCIAPAPAPRPGPYHRTTAEEMRGAAWEGFARAVGDEALLRKVEP